MAISVLMRQQHHTFQQEIPVGDAGCACGCVIITAPVTAPLSCAAQPAPVAAPCGCACAGGCALELRGSACARGCARGRTLWLRVLPWPLPAAERACVPVAARLLPLSCAPRLAAPVVACACVARLWLMHAAVRVLTRYNHQLQRCAASSPWVVSWVSSSWQRRWARPGPTPARRTRSASTTAATTFRAHARRLLRIVSTAFGLIHSATTASGTPDV